MGYVNAIRNRSNATPISASELTLDFILDERARELNFEGHRRTDLIRLENSLEVVIYGHGKVVLKTELLFQSHYNLFPIPLKAIQANPKLTQNPGYINI